MFKFRLTSVLRLREYREKSCRDEVAKWVYSLRVAKEKEEELNRNISFMLAEMEKRHEGRVRLQELLLQMEYLKHLQKLLEKQKEIIRQLYSELSQARAGLLVAMKERKIIAKLQEKQLQVYLYQTDKKEQAVLDDLVNSSVRGNN